MIYIGLPYIQIDVLSLYCMYDLIFLLTCSLNCSQCTGSFTMLKTNTPPPPLLGLKYSLCFVMIIYILLCPLVTCVILLMLSLYMPPRGQKVFSFNKVQSSKFITFYFTTITFWFDCFTTDINDGRKKNRQGNRRVNSCLFFFSALLSNKLRPLSKKNNFRPNFEMVWRAFNPALPYIPY